VQGAVVIDAAHEVVEAVDWAKSSSGWDGRWPVSPAEGYGEDGVEEELEDDGEEGDDVIESLAASEEASAGAREADCGNA